MYAHGMTSREIQGHLREIYGVEVSPDLVSTVTDAVLDEVRAWQPRPLDAVSQILYLDALRVKVRDRGRVANRAIYLAIGVTPSGLKEVLGLWASEIEGAKFWLGVITELKNRGVSDVSVACVDGRTGDASAIEPVFPQARVQVCLVHLIRHALADVSDGDGKQVATGLEAILFEDHHPCCL